MSISNKAKVLLIGRKGDAYSKHFESYLSGLNINLKSSFSSDKDTLKKLFNDWSGDYIFLFRSRYILKKEQIKKASLAAINFHPGPPNYRGSGCANFALLNEEETYGCTAHIVSPKIDEGSILSVKNFIINKNDNIESLLKRTHINLLALAKSVSKRVLCDQNSIKKMSSSMLEKQINWSGKVGKLSDIDDLMKIGLDENKKNMERKIRALQYDKFRLHIEFNGKKFYLED